MSDTNDVTQGSSPAAGEGVSTQTQGSGVATPPVATPAHPTGSQTPPENLYAALAEERRARKELEDKLNQLNAVPPTDEVYSDEGRALKTQLSAVEQKLAALEEEREFERVLAQFPDLREHADDFKAYRAGEHPRAKLESVAKLYRVEKGLAEPKRVGLEDPTGGTRGPAPQSMTLEDVNKLRQTNFKEYTRRLNLGHFDGIKA